MGVVHDTVIAPAVLILVTGEVLDDLLDFRLHVCLGTAITQALDLCHQDGMGLRIELHAAAEPVAEDSEDDRNEAEDDSESVDNILRLAACTRHKSHRREDTGNGNCLKRLEDIVDSRINGCVLALAALASQNLIDIGDERVSEIAGIEDACQAEVQNDGQCNPGNDRSGMTNLVMNLNKPKDDEEGNDALNRTDAVRLVSADLRVEPHEEHNEGNAECKAHALRDRNIRGLKAENKQQEVRQNCGANRAEQNLGKIHAQVIAEND